MIYDRHLRLEPRRPDYDFDRGIQGEIADPVWFLGRQWQMGEHQGEDAGSPVQVRVWVATRILDPLAADPRWLNPQITPPEAIVESEPSQWWTIGRRIRYGARFRAKLSAAQVAGLGPESFFRLPRAGSRNLGVDLPAPYERFNCPVDASGTCAGPGQTFLDGFAVWQRRAALGLNAADFPDIPPDEPADLC